MNSIVKCYSLFSQTVDFPRLLDGSELLRPEVSPHGGVLDKPVSKFRDYTIEVYFYCMPLYQTFLRST